MRAALRRVEVRLLLALASLALERGTLAAQTTVATLPGQTAGERFGASVAVVGDFDGDGNADFAAGAPGWSGGAGRVDVISSATHQVLASWSGSAQDDYAGHALASAGDLGGDGFPDVVIGIPQARAWPPYSLHGSGRVEVRSNGNSTPLVIAGASFGDRFGWSVASGGDLDGDGGADVWIGAPGANAGDGRIVIASGASGAILRVHDGVLGSAENFGWSVAVLGDLNGDQRAEYAVGAPAMGHATTGWVRGFDGASGQQLWEKIGLSATGDELGWALAPITDLNGDGHADLLASARRFGCDGCEGKGYVLALNGLSGAQFFVKFGALGLSPLGAAVTGIGDLNGDTREDFAAGQSCADDFNGGSHFTLVASGFNGFALATIPTTGFSDSFGAALASADANADGLRDVIVGAPRADPAGTDSGSISVVTLVRTVRGYCTAQTNSLGCVPTIYGSGTPSVSSAASFDVGTTNLLNRTSALLYYGFAPQAQPFQGGYLCVAPPLTRTAVQLTGGHPPPADCSGTTLLDFNARIDSGVDPALVSGQEVFAQVWSRDPSSASTTNRTAGLAFFINP